MRNTREHTHLRRGRHLRELERTRSVVTVGVDWRSQSHMQDSGSLARAKEG